MQHVLAAGACGNHLLDPRGIQQRADAVAVPREQPRQHGNKLGRHLAFALWAGAEIDRGAQVQQKPRRHLAVFGEHAHVRGLHARRHVPVDVAHVVVHLVFAQIGQIEPRTAHQRAVVAQQQAIQPAQHRPFEAAQDVLGVGRGGFSARRVGHRVGRRGFFAAQPVDHGAVLRRRCAAGDASIDGCAAHPIPSPSFRRKTESKRGLVADPPSGFRFAP